MPASFDTRCRSAFGLALSILMLSAGACFCGYGITSSWDPGTEVLTWKVFVESGSPQPFRDFHVEVNDFERGNYHFVPQPTGWNLSQARDSVNHRHWISFFGDSARTDGIFMVRYTGPYDMGAVAEWRVTDDGDYWPNTGVIAGEGGHDALGPWVGSNPDFKVAVHVMPHADRTCAKAFPVITACSDIVAAIPDNDVDFFPVFYDLVEFIALEYSVTWPGTYSCAFTSCSDAHSGTIKWPAGTVPWELGLDRISHVWLTCQQSPVVVPGWGWIYEPQPAVVRMVPSTMFGELRVLGCNSTEDLAVCSFAAGIGGALGEDPCGPSAVEPTTWGEIKHLFE